MKISVLAENTSVCPTVGSEHGLSLFIETDSLKILFDMGQSELFADNAEKLGVNIGSADFAVLSHGHYDHGGGLGTFFSHNRSAPVYLSCYAFEPHYNAMGKYIGLDNEFYNRERLVFCDGVTNLAEGVTIYGGKSKSELKTLGARGMQVMGKSGLEPDDFCHEQYLLIEERGRRFLFSGCSHRGAKEIAEYFSPDVFIGGFHFSKTDTENGEGRALLESEAKALLIACSEYYTCHCTGRVQFEFLKTIMGEKLKYLSAGQTVIL